MNMNNWGRIGVFDLETTGLDPDVDRVFLIALRTPEGEHELLEAAADDDAGRFAARVGIDDMNSLHDCTRHPLSLLSHRNLRAGRDALMNDRQHLFALFALDRQTGGAHPLRAEAALLNA